MHIIRTNPTPTETKLVIHASKEELAKAKTLALKHLAPQVKVPGFRTGKVPLEMIERTVDSNMLQTEVIEETINKLYASAVRQENLRPVANPDVSIKKFVPFTNLEFEATIPTVGEIKLANYKKIKASKPNIKVEAKDVNEVLTSLQTRAAERQEVERAAKKSDEVTIDFKGTDGKGQPVAGADGKDYPLILGSNAFIPGFEDELIGLKAGEKKSFNITFPKNYGVKALQNKSVTFEINVKKVAEMTKPALDDNFAAAVGPFKTLQDLKSDIKKQLNVERQREAEATFENELLQKLADQTTIEIPDTLIESQIERLEAEEKQNLLYRGQTWEEHLKEEGVSAEEHKVQKRPAAEQRVKIGIMLSEIAETEKIEVSPEEVEIRLQLMKGQHRDPAAQEELNKPEARQDIMGRILTEKTLERIKAYQK